MRLYASAALSIDIPDSLLRRFFHQASDELRHSAFAQIGQALARDRKDNKKQIDPQMMERFQHLWEWRISEFSQFASFQDAHRELAAFGWWIQNDVFPPLWSLQQLDCVLTLATSIDMSSFVVNRLAAIAHLEPGLTLRCLDKLVKTNTNSWGSMEWNTSVMSILTGALQQENEEIRVQAKSLISSLALRGYTRYLALVAETL